MKKEIKYLSLILFVGFLFVFSACKKEEEPDQKLVDQETIENYVQENNLNGQFTDSGLYYIIHKAGNDKHPTVTSNVTVKYKGYYLSGSIFDLSDYYTFNLSNLIEGWKEGLPLIGEGGEITLLIPGHLGYNDGVRAFDITLFSTTK
jgi:FKBP-type peptidyl-prolyl cis-trans isomerase FkpA